MKTEDIPLDNSGQRKVVKEGCEILPHIGVSILTKALVIEPVDLRDLLGLMISSQNCDSVWVSDLERHQESHRLHGVVASVDVVTHEQVVVVRDLPTNFEKFFQIVELAVDVTANCDWSSHWLHIALFVQDVFSFLAKLLDTVL